MYDVVTVGSAILDILIKSKSFKLVESKEFAGGVALCEVYEGKMEADEIEIASGGGGTNNAVSFARKGLRTAVVSEMGADIMGKMIIAELMREGVDTKYLVTEEGEETGTSVVLVAVEGGRSIVTYRGASRRLTHKDFPWSDLKTKWLHISSLGGRIALLEELVSWAGKNKVNVSLNPGSSELKHKERMMKIIKKVKALFVNRKEATLFTGDDYTDDRIYRSEACLVGPEISVITAGKQGGKVCVEGKCRFYKGNKIKKVCSVGAGDAFGSGFVSGLILGKPLDKAIEWGAKNAESVLQYLSAKEGLLHRSELEDKH